MKKLFCVTNRESGKPIQENNEIIYFEKKYQAKKFRDELNKGTLKYKISKGPEHRLY